MGRKDQEKRQKKSKEGPSQQQRYVTIKVTEETQQLLRVYCGLTNKKMSLFLSETVKEKLEPFAEMVDTLKRSF